MAIAFSSLLLSNTYVLNQFGFVLVAASLVDTFIVRTLLVPALMFFAVESNWWPGKVPPGVRTALTDEDEQAAAVEDASAEMSSPVHATAAAASVGLGAVRPPGDIAAQPIGHVFVKSPGIKLRTGAGRFCPVLVWAGDAEAAGLVPAGFDRELKRGRHQVSTLPVGSQLDLLERLDNVRDKKRVAWLKVKTAAGVVGFLPEADVQQP